MEDQTGSLPIPRKVPTQNSYSKKFQKKTTSESGERYSKGLGDKERKAGELTHIWGESQDSLLIKEVAGEI